MRRPKPKFTIGQVVFDKDTGQPFHIRQIHFDPTDGWEYCQEPPYTKKLYRFTFEEDLLAATPNRV